MKYANVEQAVVAARVFAEKADALLSLTNQVGMNNLETVVQGSASAATRRASLELTKSLARMRASDWVGEEE